MIDKAPIALIKLGVSKEDFILGFYLKQVLTSSRQGSFDKPEIVSRVFGIMGYMEEKVSTDFKFLITLPYWKAKVAKRELYKRKIPTKIVTHGTKISWDELRGGGASPLIFVPPFPRDIYIPENRLKEGREVLAQLGWTESEISFKIHTWQKILSLIVLLLFVAYLIFLVKVAILFMSGS